MRLTEKGSPELDADRSLHHGGNRKRLMSAGQEGQPITSTHHGSPCEQRASKAVQFRPLPIPLLGRAGTWHEATLYHTSHITRHTHHACVNLIIYLFNLSVTASV